MMGNMKKTKRRPMLFRYFDCEVFEEYLREQSKKGWHLCEFRLGMVFEKGEPEDRQYAVEVFPKGSGWDLRPTPKTTEYAQYCEAAGWRFIDATRKFCVFERVREDAQPIVTAEEHLDNMWEAGRAEIWLDILLTGLLTFIWGLDLIGPSGERGLFDNRILLLMAVILALLLIEIFDAVFQYGNYRSGKRRLRKGEEKVLKRTGEKWFRRARLLLWTVLILVLFYGISLVSEHWWLFWGWAGLLLMINAVVLWMRPVDPVWVMTIISGVMALIMLIAVLVVSALEWEEARTKENRIIPALTQADYSNPEGVLSESDYEIRESFLGRWEQGSATYRLEEGGSDENSREDAKADKPNYVVETGEQGITIYEEAEQTPAKEDHMEYDVYRSKFSSVLDRVQDKHLGRREYETMEADTWEAEEAWQARETYGVYYLARYGESFLHLYVQEPLTQEQVQKVRQTLRL